MDGESIGAYCSLLHELTGGQYYICDRPYECGSCGYAQEFLSILTKAELKYGWECSKCMSTGSRIKAWLPVLYQSGWKDKTTCLGEFNLPSQSTVILDGCTKCGYESNFLQLVVRKE